jgi:hypothetical protein
MPNKMPYIDKFIIQKQLYIFWAMFSPIIGSTWLYFTVSGSVHPSCCRSAELYTLIYYSKAALHVSGDVFAHHQEHLTVFYSIW